MLDTPTEVRQLTTEHEMDGILTFRSEQPDSAILESGEAPVTGIFVDKVHDIIPDNQKPV